MYIYAGCLRDDDSRAKSRSVQVDNSAHLFLLWKTFSRGRVNWIVHYRYLTVLSLSLSLDNAVSESTSSIPVARGSSLRENSGVLQRTCALFARRWRSNICEMASADCARVHDRSWLWLVNDKKKKREILLERASRFDFSALCLFSFSSTTSSACIFVKSPIYCESRSCYALDALFLPVSCSRMRVRSAVLCCAVFDSPCDFDLARKYDAHLFLSTVRHTDLVCESCSAYFEEFAVARTWILRLGSRFLESRCEIAIRRMQRKIIQ